MIAHQAEAQNTYFKTNSTDCYIIHPCNKILITFENVVSFQSMTADVIISTHFFAMKLSQT